jgi:hypothetical protein
MHKENPDMWILNNDPSRRPSRLIALTGLRRAASLAAGSMIAFIALVLPLSAYAQAPPITDPNDARCVDKPENIPEDVFFLNVFTPANGVVGPGSQIGAWYSDETMPNTTQRPTFVLTGPNTNRTLAPVGQEPHNLNADARHKECRHQVNITTTIPGGAYAPGDYTVTLTAFDGDEAPDKGTHVWTFTVAAPPPPPSPSPTSGTSPASSPGPSSGSSPTSGVQAASTTGPGLPRAGHNAGTSSPEGVIGIGVLLTLVGLVGFAISRRIRRPS